MGISSVAEDGREALAKCWTHPAQPVDVADERRAGVGGGDGEGLEIKEVVVGPDRSEPPFFKGFDQSRPERFILTVTLAPNISRYPSSHTPATIRAALVTYRAPSRTL